MPLAQIHILEGRSKEQKRMLMQEVTAAISRSLDTPPESVRVLLYEIPQDQWAVGGMTMAERNRRAVEETGSA
ncbi:MAG: 2-hydroxymuconate tautomerase family protein [Alicyclobacillus macrosporangiidus]|uniref:2-hydroxymuconate tautomerase n=1 Tax=Alicyclobacillus macrosporangiidus TaxID=392015 RepID=UPI0026EC9519|nr:2-hydroxymuconate tautomerase [Alicyclobacillus macrosporangiidus]MCL6598151.1 2-hydroxymuconate tautomerase family protein [Alicyclobacillus macrosporangiidus]